MGFIKHFDGCQEEKKVPEGWSIDTEETGLAEWMVDSTAGNRIDYSYFKVSVDFAGVVLFKHSHVRNASCALFFALPRGTARFFHFLFPFSVPISYPAMLYRNRLIVIATKTLAFQIPSKKIIKKS